MPWDPSQQADADAAAPDAKAENKDAATERPVDGKPIATDAKPIVPTDEDLDENGKPAGEKIDDAEKIDPADAKSLSILQKAEKRQRDQIAALKAEARAELEAERARIQPLVKQVQEFQALSTKVKDQPRAVLELLRSLGVPPSHYAEISRQAWFASPEAATDPKSKAQAEATSREFEATSKLDQALAKIAELETRYEANAKQTSQERAVGKFMDAIQKADESVRAAFESDPDETRDLLVKLAIQIDPDADSPPEVADVIAAFRKHQATEATKLAAKMKALGYDVTPKGGKSAAETRPAKTLDPTSTSATPVPVAKKLSAEEQRKKLLAEMPWDAEVS